VEAPGIEHGAARPKLEWLGHSQPFARRLSS
jgi:hypothetical protein